MRCPIAVLIAALVLAGCGSPAPDARGPGRLTVGSPAPALSPVRYLTKANGPQEFKPGQIYVLDFWATWCAPCVRAMPHLAELQATYADKGVTVIALATPGDKDEVTDTEEFAEREGERLKIAIALEETPANGLAFMRAAGQSGIPCTFVIGRDGKIAFIGDPTDGLDAVLKALVAKGG